MGGLMDTKCEQTQSAQHSSWFTLSHTFWARLRGRGMYLWPTRFMLHESVHLPTGFEFPTVSFYRVFLTFLCLHWKENWKLSWSWRSLFFISLPGWVPSAPCPRHVASTPSCGLYEAMLLIPLTTFSVFRLHLITLPHPICFPSWWNTRSKAFPHVQLFPG